MAIRCDACVFIAISDGRMVSAAMASGSRRVAIQKPLVLTRDRYSRFAIVTIGSIRMPHRLDEESLEIGHFGAEVGDVDALDEGAQHGRRIGARGEHEPQAGGLFEHLGDAGDAGDAETEIAATVALSPLVVSR